MRTECEIVDYISEQPWGAELCTAAFKQRVNFDFTKNIINQIDWTSLSHTEAYWKELADQYDRWLIKSKPTTWSEYCSNSNAIGLCYINDCCQIRPYSKGSSRDPNFDVNVMSEPLCKAFLALMRLKQLRDAWCLGFNVFPYKIHYTPNDFSVSHSVDYKISLTGLSFPTEDLANEFIQYFRSDLLEACVLL